PSDVYSLFFSVLRLPLCPTLFPYTPLFRSSCTAASQRACLRAFSSVWRSSSATRASRATTSAGRSSSCSRRLFHHFPSCTTSRQDRKSVVQGKSVGAGPLCHQRTQPDDCSG